MRSTEISTLGCECATGGMASTRLSQAWKSRLMRLSGALVAGMGGWILYQAWLLFKAQAGWEATIEGQGGICG